MIILGIETSCDETAAAVVQKQAKGIKILSNIVASSAKIQAKYGGVIPEQAAREQLKSIIPVINEALNQAFPNVILRPKAEESLPNGRPTSVGDPSLIVQDDRIKKIDAIAVTYGPGLIGSLLVGTETAKTLALTWKKPLIAINHLLGHFYANWINSKYRVESIMYSGKKQKNNPFILDTLYSIPKFPCIGLLVSGGHTDLVFFTAHDKYQYLGGTRDDAAGECFDKCARLLNLPYPGGPSIAKSALKGNPKAFNLPRPMIDSQDLDFSFSGLKTAVANLPDKSHTEDLAASTQAAIVEVLVAKTVKASAIHKVKNIMIAGGVAANERLREELKKTFSEANIFIPPLNLCTDNASMIASAGFFLKPLKNPLTLQADPNLALSL